MTYTVPVEEAIDRSTVKQDVFNIFRSRGIKTPQELDFFFIEYLGITIPKKKICPNHMAPFDIICDIYFNKPSISLWISSRGSGKTYLLSNLDIAHLTTKKNFDIIHSAAIQYQSERAYEYFSKSLKEENIQKILDGEPTRNKTTTLNDSSLSLITMTWQGTNSPHVPLLVIDEVELIKDWSLIQEALCIPQSSSEYRAQTTMMSTRKWDNGIVQRIVDESEERNIKVYESCIFEVLEKCTRECFDNSIYLKFNKEGNCPAYSKKNIRNDGTVEEKIICGGKAHECEGFYKIDDFVDKTVQLDVETIDAQYLCNKPVGYKGAHVFEMIKGIQIGNWKMFKYCTGYDRPLVEWKRIAGVDFESVFVYAMAAIEPLTGRMWVYQEYYNDADRHGMATLEEHAGRIQNLDNWSPLVKAWADASAKQEIYELKKKGVPSTKSPKKSLRTSVDLVRTKLKINEVLGTPMLIFIEEEVPEVIKSMSEWGFLRNKDGTVDYDNYDSENDHGADVIRYMNIGYHTRSELTVGRIKGLYG
jgi:hypothetical protein